MPAPTEKPKIVDLQGGYVQVAHPEIPETPVTTIDEFAAAGATALVVGSTAGLANQDQIIIGDPDTDGTDPVKVNAAVSPGTALTVTATTVSHPAGTPIRKVAWTKIQLAHAATLTGAKTTLTAQLITWQQPFTEAAMGASDAYWFVRFVDAAGTGFSDWSDGIPESGYEEDTVRKVIEGALSKGDYRVGGKITEKWLLQQVTNCEIHVYGRRRNWPQFDRNDVPIGRLTPGVTRFDIPTDIADPDTMESIRALRVRGIPDLRYINREEYDGIRWDLAVSPLAVATVIGGTEVFVDDVGDFEFDDGGTIQVGSDSITFTGIDRTLNKFTGCTGITAIWPVDMEVFQGPDVAQVPTVATIIDRQIALPLPVATDFQNRLVYLTYYGRPTYPASDAVKVNFRDPELYHWYIAWQIELKLHNGTETAEAAGHKANYNERERLLLNKTRLTDQPRVVPRRPFPRQQAAEEATPDIISWKLR